MIGPKGKPCCPCLEEANYVVWSAPVTVKKKFKHNYQTYEKIKSDDYVARSYWMDAYIECLKERGLKVKDYSTPT